MIRNSAVLFLFAPILFACDDGNPARPNSSSHEERADAASAGDSGSTENPEPARPLLDGGAPLGKSCSSHEDCQTQYCLSYSDVPGDENAACAEATPPGDLRLTGTVRDLITSKPVAAAKTRVLGAIAAVSNPRAGKAFATTASDDRGRVDAVAADVDGTLLGLVAIAEKEDYFLTATGLGAPFDGTSEYRAGNSIHDLWLLSEQTLADWSESLAADSELEGLLPLGAQGGVVVLVRDAENGEPIAGAHLVSQKGDNTTARFRYLDEDGQGFSKEVTSSLGLALMLGPSVGEGFGALVGEVEINRNLAGSTKNAIMVVALQGSPE